MRRDLPAIVLICAMMVLFLPAIVLPFLSPSGTLVALDGRINVMDHPELWNDLDMISCFFYSLGDMICHQEQSRTFILNGNEMYICIRDFSLLTGFIIGLVVTIIWPRCKDIDRRKAIVYLFLVLITPVEWLVENQTNIDVPVIRSITAVLTGAVIGIALIHIIERTLSENY